MEGAATRAMYGAASCHTILCNLVVLYADIQQYLSVSNMDLLPAADIYKGFSKNMRDDIKVGGTR